MNALYCRVSTQEQAREGYSIGEQEERLQNYCSALGWHGIKPYIDAGFSGGTTDRPALQALIKDIEAGKIERVVVYKLDRLSRSQKDTLELIEDVFIKNGVDFVSVSENFQTETAFGRAMVGILAVFAQLEREQIKERMSIGREGRAKIGKWGGGANVPIGYDYKDGALVVNTYEAMQIKEIHELYRAGESYRSIVRILASKGYTHKYGVWSTFRVRYCIRNALYIGYINYNGKVFKGEHTPLIDEETYRVNLERSKNNRAFSKYGRNSYLAGVIYCKRCGARYTSRLAKHNDVKYHYYVCTNRATIKPVKAVHCKNKNYNQEKLDEIVFNELRKLVPDVDNPAEIIGADNSDELEKRLETIKKELDKLDSKKSRIIDLYSVGEFSIEDIESKIKELNGQKAKLEAELHQIAEELTAEKDYNDVILTIDDIINEGDYEDKRALIFELIDRIDIDGEDIFIRWNF